MFCVLDCSSNISPLIVIMPDVFAKKARVKKAKKMRATRKPRPADFLLQTLYSTLADCLHNTFQTKYTLPFLCIIFHLPFIFIHFYPLLSTLIHFQPLLSTFIHFYPLLSTFIHFYNCYPFLSTSIHFYQLYLLLYTFIIVYPLLATFFTLVHFYPHLYTFIHFYPLLSTFLRNSVFEKLNS